MTHQRPTVGATEAKLERLHAPEAAISDRDL